MRARDQVNQQEHGIESRSLRTFARCMALFCTVGWIVSLLGAVVWGIGSLPGFPGAAENKSAAGVALLLAGAFAISWSTWLSLIVLAEIADHTRQVRDASLWVMHKRMEDERMKAE